MTSIEFFRDNDFCHPSRPTMPYLIAEAGVNHEGKMDLAKRLIDEAKEGGADAIKFQTYKAETLASKDSPAYWDLREEPTTSQYALFKKHDSFWKEEFVQIKEYCDSVGIEFLSTPFDIESARFLNQMMSVYKISSSDLNNIPFVRYLIGFSKPILLSTGASRSEEIDRTVREIQAAGLPLALLHCVLNYPTPSDRTNLARITTLSKRYPGICIGYSDHVVPGDMTTCLSAVLIGASVIEKHFTFDKTLPGNDHYHAMDMKDLFVFKKRLTEMIVSCGDGRIDYGENEILARKNARRSLVADRKISEGHQITAGDLTWKRPASGIGPENYDKVLGQIASRDIQEDEILQWDDLYAE